MGLQGSYDRSSKPTVYFKPVFEKQPSLNVERLGFQHTHIKWNHLMETKMQHVMHVFILLFQHSHGDKENYDESQNTY
jgi:hypothetical protein